MYVIIARTEIYFCESSVESVILTSGTAGDYQ